MLRFLFPAGRPAPDRSAEQAREDEAVDCSVVVFLREKVLDQPSLFPHSFILSVMVILNKGSIHSHSGGPGDINQNQAVDSESAVPIREEFAKICFETLLQYSLLERPSSQAESETSSAVEEAGQLLNGLDIQQTDVKVTNKLAVTSLLHRYSSLWAPVAGTT